MAIFNSFLYVYQRVSHSWMMLDLVFPPHGKFIGNSTHPSGLYVPHLALQPLVVHVHHLNIQDA